MNVISFIFAEFQSEVVWDNNWIHYLDTMLQLPTLHHMEKSGELVVPVMIHEILIDPTVMELDPEPKGKSV